MNQSKKKTLHIPLSYNHLTKGELIPIADVTEITPENKLKRSAKDGLESRG